MTGVTKMTWRARMRRWWLGLVSASIQGGAVSVKALAFPAVLAGYNVVPALGLKQMLGVFAGAAIYHMWDYLSRNPLVGEKLGEGEKSGGAEDEKEAVRVEAGRGILTNRLGS
jgi:hypothetical protein